MVEKRIRDGPCHATHRYAKANNKTMKDYNENKESSYLTHWDINNLYGWAMLQKLPVGDFIWVENRSKFHKDSIKNNEDTDIGYILKVCVQFPEILHEVHNDIVPFFDLISL